MNPTAALAELGQLVEEHRQLTRHIQGEQQWFEEVRQLGKPSFGELGSRLRGLRDKLADHFSHEEAVEQAAANRGDCKASPAVIAELKTVHGQLLARLDAVIARASGNSENYDFWGEAATESSEVFKDLHAHETDELNLLNRIVGMVGQSGGGKA